jgi:hypothetical protein
MPFASKNYFGIRNDDHMRGKRQSFGWVPLQMMRRQSLLIICLVLIFARVGLSISWSADAATKTCSQGNTLPDGCQLAQASGAIIDSHLADPQAVVALNVTPGRGYNDGTFGWISTGGGCSRPAAGTIIVAGGLLGGARGGSWTISDHGAGCASRPAIFVPSEAGYGSGGRIIPSVYQKTPHNSSPPYNMPGIDYPVGYDTKLVLADPTTAKLPTGATVSGHTVTIGGNNVTLNGYDFSLHGTTLVINGGITGCVVTNNKFKIAAAGQKDLQNILLRPGSTDCAIKYNWFDGSSVHGTGSGIPGGAIANVNVLSTSGVFTFEYNYCFLPDSKCLNFGGHPISSETLNVVEKYNYYGELGTCGAVCSHGEAEYSYSGFTSGAVFQILAPTVQFNVAVTHMYSGPTNLASQMAVVGDAVAILGADIEYNYELSQGDQAYAGSRNRLAEVASSAMFCGHQENGSNSGGIMAHNILDYSGAFFPYNGSGGTCARDFPNISDINAGTGNRCNPSTCN